MNSPFVTAHNAKEMQSPHSSKKLTYEVGKTYSVEEFDTSDEECSTGIHVVTSLALALKWGPVVVKMSVPEDAEVVWGPNKIRVSSATVVGVVSLSMANLSRADLKDADLPRAYLSRANLYRANLSGADLSMANLSRAHMSGADLSMANLSRAHMSGADLSMADLSGAYMSGADLSRADLSRATGTPISGMPEGWKIVDGYWVKGERDE